MNIGYLGPEGTFSQIAADKYVESLKSGANKTTAFSRISDVLEAVNNGEIDEGVVPFENSIEGTVNYTLDTLISDVDIYIKKEIIIPISHNLMTRPECVGKKPEKIFSHPQSLAQCRKYLLKNYPDVETVQVLSNSEAARIVKESGKNYYAISTLLASQIYALDITEKDIQDAETNVTRFFVVTRDKSALDLDGKTSLVFSTEHKPGSLYRVLDILAIWDINLTKIESRPMKDCFGKYVFYIDFECNDKNDRQEAMRMLKRKTDFFKFLGTYNEITTY